MTFGGANQRKSRRNGSADRLIAKQVNIDKEAARFFYLEMWAYTHGIASMIATGFYEWDEPLASRALTDVYEGLKHRYENGGIRND